MNTLRVGIIQIKLENYLGEEHNACENLFFLYVQQESIYYKGTPLVTLWPPCNFFKSLVLLG